MQLLSAAAARRHLPPRPRHYFVVPSFRTCNMRKACCKPRGEWKSPGRVSGILLSGLHPSTWVPMCPCGLFPHPPQTIGQEPLTRPQDPRPRNCCIWMCPHCTSQSCMPAGSGTLLPPLLPRCRGQEAAHEDGGPREVRAVLIWDRSWSSMGGWPELHGRREPQQVAGVSQTNGRGRPLDRQVQQLPQAGAKQPQGSGRGRS